MPESDPDKVRRLMEELDTAIAYMGSLSLLFRTGVFEKKLLMGDQVERYRSYPQNIKWAAGESLKLQLDHFVEIGLCFERSNPDASFFPSVNEAHTHMKSSWTQLKISIAAGLQKRNVLLRDQVKPHGTIIDELQGLINALDRMFAILSAQEARGERGAGQFLRANEAARTAITRVQEILQ